MDFGTKLIGLPEFVSSEEIIDTQQEQKARERIASLTESAHIPMPIEWQEKNRYMPSSITENYGQFKSSSVPHLSEPLNCVHPDDPCTHIAIMKSVQSACTVTLAEGAMGFFTRYKLGSVAYFTSTKGVGKSRSSSALDVLIDNAGLASLLKPISQRMKRKTADTTFYKEFAGGVRWQISSYNSIADMKSNTFNLIIPDEWDEAGVELADQGDIAGILEGRTMATRMYKMLFISTPSRMETSRIYKEFMKGDQRRFFVPCPICDEKQVLVLKGKGTDYGLTFSMMKDPTTSASILDPNSVRYICQHCKGEFHESDKLSALQKAEWRPTWKNSEAVPASPNHRSYHVSGLISPFLPWARICQQYINTKFGQDLLLFKDFTINYLGEPWARISGSASWEALKNRADDYSLGEVPEGGLILYGGCDVQGDRLEIAIVAIGKGLEKWVVDYRIFFGNPADLNDPCWTALHEFAYGQRYRVLGSEVSISLIALDSGFNPNERAKRTKDWESKSHTVYAFVAQRTDKFIAIKGTGETKAGELIKERRNSHGVLPKRYDIATPVIKEMLMMVIDETSGPNAIHFPKWRTFDGKVKRELEDDFFKQFLSERYQEIQPGKMGWKKIQARNEVWDAVIYAVICLYFDGLQVWTDETWTGFSADLRTISNKNQ